MAPQEIAVLPEIVKAVKSAAVNVAVALCPYCGMNGGEVRRASDGELECCCPECGVVSIDAEDLVAVALDDHWLHRTLRAAQDIQADGGSTLLAEGVWLLGSASKLPVVLARDIQRLWREPGLLDRVRLGNGPIRVIAPAVQIARGAPADAGVEWVGLEERFRLLGEGVSFLGAAGAAAIRRRNEPAEAVHGPFSVDFRLVYLGGDDADPIRCTKAQADVFRALWEFEGKNRRAEEVMQRAGRRSSKPIDVFKSHQEPLRAYKALVVSNQKEGLYRMPSAIW